MKLVAVDPKNKDHVKTLAMILVERLRYKNINISHTALPAEEDHVRFVESIPYTAWYIIMDGIGTDNDKELFEAGTIYLTKQDEIGIYIREEFRNTGLGQWAVAQLMETHPRKRYLANINPSNTPSINFFGGLGFKPLQLTMVQE